MLIKAIIDSNLPKFVKRDKPIFLAIMQDLFPGANFSQQSQNEDLKEMLEFILKEEKKIMNPEYISKLVQIFDTL